MTIILSQKQQDYNESITQNRLKIGKHVCLINPSDLDIIERQAIWKGIKHKNPALAELLKHDTNIKRLKEVFGASIVFTEKEIADFIKD